MLPRISPSAAAPRFVLEGVPRVHFYEGGPRCPEDVTLPSCVRACLEYLGDSRFGCKHVAGCGPGCSVTCSYAYFMGASGAAAFLSWKPGWSEDNLDVRWLSDDADAPFRAALAAAGYGCEVLNRDRHDETTFRARIVESLRDRRHPVIALGVVGPPESCLITGYDESGDVLIGWNFFQGIPPVNAGVEFEPSGEFRVRDWYRNTEALILIGERHEALALGDAYRAALAGMVQTARTPLTWQNRRNGLAAYAAWADALLCDEAFPADDEAVLRAHFGVHNLAVGNLAECRWYGAQFLIQAADAETIHYNLTEDLLRAAACYAGEHALMWRAWDLAGGIGNPEGYLRLSDPAVRRAMADVVMQARTLDAEATAHIEAALARPT